jgi:uncharacterized protein YdaU (DUF1376 family)
VKLLHGVCTTMKVQQGAGQTKPNPAFQVYPNEWLGNPQVRLLKPAQRGMLFDLMCCCWNHHGALKAADVPGLAKMFGYSHREIETLLPTVLSFFCPVGDNYRHPHLDEQITVQQKRSIKAKRNSLTRWNANAMQTDSERHPFLEDEEEELLGDGVRGVGEGDSELGENCPAFMAFYSAYPRKVGRKNAFASWSRLSPAPEQCDAIMRHVAKAKLSHDWTKENGKYVPYPATYLNQKRWMDEVDTAAVVDLLPGFDVNDPNAKAPDGWRKEFRTGQYCEPGSTEIKTREVFYRWVREA